MRALAALLLCLVATSASAEWILKPNAPRVIAGKPFELTLFVVNDTDEPLPYAFPARLRARLAVRDRALDADLVAVDDRMITDTIAPGHFARRTYTYVPPADLGGPLTIELIGEHAPTRLTLLVERPEGVGGPAIADARQPAVDRPAGKRPPDTEPQPALQTYEPMYIVAGRREGLSTAKFQLSLKYRLFDERGPIGAFAPPLAKVYLGYTQTSIWNLTGDSKPFTDTSYKPNLFYFDPATWTSPDGRQSLGLETGLQHESNGRGGDESRSLNIAYAKPIWRQFLDDRHYVLMAPKIWAYLDKEENSDIQTYRGYFNLNLQVGRVDGLKLSAYYSKGTSTMGAVQLDLSYPIRQPFFADAGGYLYFQYFNGYGESLLDYNVKGPTQYRFGLAIVR
jgi:outer membrane phospholipase A